MEKKRLGRGLAALIPETPPITKELAIDQTETGDTVAEISLSRIQPGGHQPRRRFEEGALRELAESIKAGGVIQPLILRALSDDRYEIIAGERRWRASRIAGLETIPAIIMEADDRKVMEVSVIENLQREDLNPIEEAEALCPADRGIRSLTGRDRDEGWEKSINSCQLIEIIAITKISPNRYCLGKHLRRPCPSPPDPSDDRCPNGIGRAD